MSENAEDLNSECDRARQELLSHVLDGEPWPESAPAPAPAQGAGRERLDLHLASCVACRREEALLRATDAPLGRAPAPPLVAGFDARLKARIAREAAPTRGREDATPLRRPEVGGGARPFWHWAAAFAVAASVLIASVVVVLHLLREDPAGAGSPFIAPAPYVAQSTGPDPESPSETQVAGSGGSRAAGAVDAKTEEEIIAKLDVLENLDVAENMDLIENLEGPEDPTAGLEEDGHG